MKLNHALWLATIGFVAAITTSGAYGQVLPRNRVPPAGGVAPRPVAPAPGETAGQARREGRQEARDARAGARQAGETVPEARATARETRQETRQNIQATRAADMGVWFNSRAANGLVISDLANNGIFANAGFLAGDRIVSINGRPITSEAQFVQMLTGPNLGTQALPVVVLRDGQQQTLTLQPTALGQAIVNYDPYYQYGMLMDETNPNQMLVQRVFPRTPAYYAGLRQGDVITSLNGQPIANLSAFTQGLSQANGAVPLQITRAGQTRDIQFDPSIGAQDSVRTALRPNFDGNAATGAQLDGAGIRTGTGAAATAPGIGAAIPGASATAPGAPIRAGAAATAPSGAAPPRPTPGTPPATPANPATPGVSPATPAAPAQPGAAPGTNAGASGQAGAGTSGTGASGAAGAGASGTGASGSAGAGAGTGTPGTPR
jgi:PDZ domain-containing protein